APTVIVLVWPFQSKDHGYRVQSSETLIEIAATRLMLNRSLRHENFLNCELIAVLIVATRRIRKILWPACHPLSTGDPLARSRKTQNVHRPPQAMGPAG